MVFWLLDLWIIKEIQVMVGQCFHCLLSPVTDDPIFVGINGLFTKGLECDTDENKNNSIPCPCCITNRFECPY